MIIENGGGAPQAWAKVGTDNRLWTKSLSFTEYENASLEGKAFNVNTGLITLTGTGENACIYIKNNRSEDLFLEGFFTGVATRSGTVSDSAVVKVYRNPTGGTIVDDQSAVTLVNRNTGSNETFTDVIAYKASASGKTLTGQDSEPVLLHIQGSNSRVFGNVFLAVPRGGSVGVTIDLNTDGSSLIYTGFTGFLRD